MTTSKKLDILEQLLDISELSRLIVQQTDELEIISEAKDILRCINKIREALK